MNCIGRAALASLFGASATLASAQTVEYVPDEIFVKFRSTEGAAANSARTANAAIKARTTSVIPHLVVDRIKLPAGMSLDDALFYYNRLSSVEYAEKNSKKQLCFTPNDTQFNNQYAPQKMKLQQAWDL